MNAAPSPSLADVFASRPERFRMLGRGMALAGWNKGSTVLEIGCGRADGGAYLAERLGARVVAVDINLTSLAEARGRHSDPLNQTLTLLAADAQELPFRASQFDGIFIEAAFSPLPSKEKALECCRKALKSGGGLLINDFCVKSRKDLEACGALAHIPCFSGVNTMEHYQRLCERAGFRTLHMAEDYGEMIRIALCISKAYNIKVDDVGPYLSGYYHTGPSRCRGVDAGCREKFHARAHLSYCQMLFRKE